MRATIVGLAFAVVASGSATSELRARDISLEERVDAQKAIEQVYWSHRTWPQDNASSKPLLATVMPDAAIRNKVDDYLKKSVALADVWHRPITGDQLQAEMDRMARNTRDAEILRELFAALGNDPALIAETLAREALVNRLIHEWYANDTRLHAAIRSRAESALAAAPRAGGMRSLGGTYRETTWKIRREGNSPEHPDVISLDESEWNDRLARLSTAVASLDESNEAFSVTSVIDEGVDSFTTATVFWLKTPFETWWTTRSATMNGSLERPSYGYMLPAITVSSTCTPDTWSATHAAVAPSARLNHTAVWTGSEMIVWGGLAGAVPPFTFFNTGGRYNPATDTWVPTSTTGALTGRFHHSAVWTGSEMIIWGGGTQSYFNTGARYNPTNDSWTMTTTTGAPSARSSPTAVWTGTEMIIWGGTASSGAVLNDGARYSPATNTWVPTSNLGAPSPRKAYAVVWTDHEMIVWGGELFANSVTTYYNDGARYSPATDSWVPTTTTGAPSRRSPGPYAWTGTEMLVWGGVSDGNFVNTGARYNPSGDSWVPMSTTGAPAASNQGASVWSGTELLLWGGTGQGNAVDGGRYNPVTDSWAGLSGVGEPTARTNESVVWTGSEMILWGGVSGSSTFLNSMARYSPSSDSWLAIGAPSPRIGHTAVWTGSEMIVWGGRGITSYLNNGSRYDPATDDWTATTLTGAPWVRRGHAAVWTGSEMVVWGGYYGDAFSTWFLNTGARYNPMTDTWVPTTTVDAPDARSTPAIWTGHEMIVWGGSAGTSYLNTGGRYDPVTDHWIPTSTIGAPSPRGSFGAGWTGREMLVWGGWADLPGRVYYGSGGRYDPSTDSWTATSMAGAPVPRGEFAMVWDGHEAIVWGGEDDVTYFLATGGRYDPSTDSWTATPTLGAPAARLGPASLWTGSEMIVWGGSGTGMVDLNSGGRYNPNADQWMSTSMIGAPSARSELTAVWTGREMLVWGGHNYSTGPTFDTGGRYCAATCAVPATWFQDDDGDGVGTTAVQQLACDQPFGFAATAGDCDDANAAAYPGAAEINDSLDNQCPGDPGYGVVDEISGMCGFTDPGDRGAFCWVPQSGAVSYDVDRSTSPSFSSGCTTSNTTASCWSPADDPAPGVAQFLIVRASAPHVGSWGQDSTGVERHPICP